MENSIIQKIKEKLTKHKTQTQQSPRALRESFFKNAFISDETGYLHNHPIENFSLPKKAQSIDDFNSMLSGFLANNIKIEKTEFGEYFPATKELSHHYFHAELRQGDSSLFVINRYGSNKLSIIDPQQDYKFNAYEAGNRFCSIDQSKFLSSRLTGGAWKEEEFKKVAPVLEIDADGKITPIGGMLITNISQSNGSTGSSYETKREFVDLQTYQDLTEGRANAFNIRPRGRE